MGFGEEELKNVMGFGNFSSSWREKMEDPDGVVLVEGAQAFVCEVCNLELNSEVTFDSHIRGSRHVKKLREQAAEKGHCLVVPPSTQTRVKVPVTLHKIMEECNEPLVGLSCITEVVAISDQEMERQYYCTLCSQQGQANCMLLHLKGKVHRQRWVDVKFPGAVNMVDLSQAQLREQASLLDEGKAEKEQLNLGKSMIKTIYSDEAFPWPAGKAPWLVKNGGTGVVPEGALERFGMSGGFRQISMEEEEEESEPTGAYHALPAVDTVPAPRNIQEAQQMLALAESLIDSAMETLSQQKKKEALMLKAVKTVLVLKLGNEAGSFLSPKRACGQGA